MSDADLSALFACFRVSAARLETRDGYAVSAEAGLFADFLAGRPLPVWTVDNHDWLRRVAEDVAAGKRWQRVHVVTVPLSDYLRFQTRLYRCAAAAGERILLADRAADPRLSELIEDFWAFDLETDPAVVVMDYDGEGRPAGRRRVADEDLDRYRRQWQLAVSTALPLDDFLAAADLR